MHRKSFAAVVLLASASLSFALPASTDNVPINPAHTFLVPSAEDNIMANADRTCGPRGMFKKCQNHRGEGACCSANGYCGDGPKYCGAGCQNTFSYHNCYNRCPNPIWPKKAKAPQRRQGERCGKEHGNHKCSNNQCCSHAGYCGTGKDFCTVPTNCQVEFGWCDSKAVPAGPSTANDPRPFLTHQFSKGITQCTQPRTLALTFDDGPSENTEQLLDILRDKNAKATFFVSGNNNGKGEIDTTQKWIRAIKRVKNEGHQVGLHAFTHSDLDKLSSEDRKDDMYKMERAMSNIIGKYPTVMRPPYVRCGQGCTKDMQSLGYNVVYWGVDSTDWQYPTDLTAMTEAVDAAFDKEDDNGHIMMIQHDTIPMSALELTKHILTRAEEKGWKAVTLAECLGENKDDMYRYPATVDVSSVAPSGCVVAGDGLCGQIKPFNGKLECLDSAHDCFKQSASMNQKSEASQTAMNMLAICELQSQFCVLCGEENGVKCQDSAMR